MTIEDTVGLRYLFEILNMKNDIIVGNDEFSDGCGESEEPPVGHSHFLTDNENQERLLIERIDVLPE